MSELPEDWIKTSLGSLIDMKYGKGLKKSLRKGSGFPVYGSNGVVGEHREAITDGPAIIVGRKGSIGEVHLSNQPCWPIDTTYFINDLYGQPLRYWYYYLKSLPLAHLNKATAIPGISRSDAYKLEISLPPLNEQRRIADKLDQILTEVNAAKVRLDQIPNILKKFRQSTLRSAIAGKLSDHYKNKKQNSKIYLKTLLDDRKSNYLGGKNYKDPESHRNDYLEEFPNHWSVVSLDHLSAKIVDGTHRTPIYTETGIPFISVKDIRNGRIYFDKCRYVSEETHQELIKRCHPERGDILITKSGTIGRLAVIDIDTKFSLFVSVALIKLASKNVSAHYIAFVLEDWINRIDIGTQIVGTAIKNLHLRDMRVLPIPLPSYEEQLHIVDRARELLLLADRIEGKYKVAMESVDKIMRSILAKAFRGELVPQDPNDEPASELLERIKAEKELQKLVPKQKRRKIPQENQEVKKMILSVFDALKNERKSLSAQSLLQKAGYPVDSDPEKIEEFFLDIKNSLQEGTIVRERVGDEDIFRLAV